MFGGHNVRKLHNPPKVTETIVSGAPDPTTFTLKRGSLAALLMLAAALMFAGCGTTSTTAESADSMPDTSLTGVDHTAKDSADESASTATHDATTDAVATELTHVGASSPADASRQNTPADVERDDELGEPNRNAAPVSFADDFSQSVQPILTEKCAACHGVGGPGSPHWVLGTAQDAVDTHLLISGVVSSGSMPPWPATDLSVDFHQNRSLADDQIQAILDWSAAGATLDINADAPIAASAGPNRLADPDVVISPASPYAGDGSKTDDLRCQIYDPQMPDGGFITGYEFIPDQSEVVHHAVGYLVTPDQLDRVRSLDGADGLPGWACPGMPGIPDIVPFLLWTPGQDATTFPTGSAYELVPGAFILVQIHYHYEGTAPFDASTFALEFASEQEIADSGGRLDRIVVTQALAPVEIPCASWEQGPLCDRDTALADARARLGDSGVIADLVNQYCGYSPEDFAGFTEGIAYSECTFPAAALGTSGELVSVVAHMHEIGDWFRVTLNPGKFNESILLDIEDWDFDWQYSYELAEPIAIGPFEPIKVECGWDRSLRDADLEPAYIVWADGTNDEMCTAVLTFIQ